MTEIGKIRSLESLLEATPNLGEYQGDFAAHNSKIYPTDLDAIVEVKGHFLAHEYKKVGAPPNKGQEILLENLRKKGFAIIQIYHVGPCFDMNFDKAVFSVPDYMPLKNDGTTQITKDVNVLSEVKRFHDWWTKRVLRMP